MQAATERFEMRLDPADLDRIDEWRGSQPGLPSRSEAVRTLLNVALRPRVAPTPFSDGEKILLWMISDLFKSLKIKSDFEPKFMQKALVGGHYWAIRREHSGLFPREVDEAVVSEVTNFLDMWRFIESAGAQFSKAERTEIAKEVGAARLDFRFPGFDHQNGEVDHLSVARFYVEELDSFSFLKGRDLDSHFQTLPGYRRMYVVFEPIRANLIGRELNVREMMSILKARR